MATVELYATITKDPAEGLRFAASGNPWLTLNLAENRKAKDGTETTTWWKAKVFGHRAEELGESLRKGQRVKLRGFLDVEEWTTREGEKRTDLVVKPFDDGVTVEGARAPQQQQSGQWGASARAGRAPKDQPADDPWAQNATAGTNYSDTPTF